MQSQAISFFLLLFLLPRPGEGSDSPKARPSLLESQRRWEQWDQSLSSDDRRVLGGSRKESLSPRLRKLSAEREKIKKEIVFWNRVIQLENDLVGLPLLDFPRNPLERLQEAEQIAITAIRTFGEMERKFKMIRPAWFHNILVNVHLKKEGFCWHWTREMMGRLRSLSLRHYDLLWAVSRQDSPREHNTVVVVSKGKGLSQGLLLDGWRFSGKPFWARVQEDKYPWKLSSSPLEELLSSH